MVADPLKPHQQDGAAFLASRPFGLLADSPGAGKTATLIRACDLADARRVLVFCPAAVRPHWELEFLRWQRVERPVRALAGHPKAPPGPGVTIMAHAALVKPAEYARLWHAGPYDAIIADEGHEFRAYTAARARHLYAPALADPKAAMAAPMPDGLWTRAKHVWHASGTPVVNSAADLYPLLGGPLAGRTDLDSPSWWEFCTKFTDLKPDSFNGMKPTGVREAEALRATLRPWTLRRDFDVGVPLRIDAVPLPVPETALTEALAGLEGWTPEKLREVLESGEEPSDAAISRVRRALGLAKAPAAAAAIDSVLRDGGGPLVAFYHHRDVRDALHRALTPRWRVGWIDGSVNRAQLQAGVEWFQTGRMDVLLVQTQAGGTGLTLTRANVAAVVELPWTAAALLQAVKRVHRLGQTRPCFGALLTARCWLEEVMLRVLATKKSMSEEIFGPLTELVA